jgi:hypothetical protein
MPGEFAILGKLFTVVFFPLYSLHSVLIFSIPCHDFSVPFRQSVIRDPTFRVTGFGFVNEDNFQVIL